MGKRAVASAAGEIGAPMDRAGERSGADPEPKVADYDVLVIGGGPAGLAAASFCGRKMLRTAVFEGDSWGGILTRWCPDKRIDNYPGVGRGILARDLAHLLLDNARRAGIDLYRKRVEEITPDGELTAGDMKARGKRLILANGSTAAEAGILGEREFAGPRGGVHYRVRDPSVFRGKNVVVVGGGDTGLSVVQRLTGIASRITLVHRKPSLHTQGDGPAGRGRAPGVTVLLDCTVEEILGTDRVGSVKIRSRATGEESLLDADAVVMAVGRRPNTAIFRDLDLSLDDQGQVRTDVWQRTSVPGFLAVGDVSSHLKMIVTAVAQGATAAHEAFLDIRTPYWK